MIVKRRFVNQHEVMTSLEDPPSGQDMDVALQQLKNGKAAGI